ncbi:MAG: hypothetical protein J5794_05430 [Lachnospiraceae bacterium]|nr:hypothetical protein [Lachnospiraceae bacterium]
MSKDREKRNKRRAAGALAAVLICGLLLGTGCKEPVGIPAELSEGLRYLSEEGQKDPAKAQAEIRAGRESYYASAEETDEPAVRPTEGTEASSEPASEAPSIGPTEAPTEAVTEAPKVTEAAPSPNVSLSEEIQTKNIHLLTEEERAYYKKCYENTIFVGDSLTQAILTYGYLDGNSVKYIRGATIDKLGSKVDEALAMIPDRIIFFKGLNDANVFMENTAGFYAAYKAQIERVRNANPSIRICIVSLLPPSTYLAAVRADLARSGDFDAELKRLCSDMGLTYIDCHWMAASYLYLEDGIHFKEAFYSVFIRYVADLLGLSDSRTLDKPPV